MFANPNCSCFGLCIENSHPSTIYCFFCFRQQCYKCVLDSLQRLLVIKTSPLQSPGLPTQPGPPPAPDPNTMTPLEADKLVCYNSLFSIRLGFKSILF